MIMTAESFVDKTSFGFFFDRRSPELKRIRNGISAFHLHSDVNVKREWVVWLGDRILEWVIVKTLDKKGERQAVPQVKSKRNLDVMVELILGVCAEAGGDKLASALMQLSAGVDEEEDDPIPGFGLQGPASSARPSDDSDRDSLVYETWSPPGSVPNRVELVGILGILFPSAARPVSAAGSASNIANSAPIYSEVFKPIGAVGGFGANPRGLVGAQPRVALLPPSAGMPRTTRPGPPTAPRGPARVLRRVSTRREVARQLNQAMRLRQQRLPQGFDGASDTLGDGPSRYNQMVARNFT